MEGLREDYKFIITWFDKPHQIFRPIARKIPEFSILQKNAASLSSID